MLQSKVYAATVLIIRQTCDRFINHRENNGVAVERYAYLHRNVKQSGKRAAVGRQSDNAKT
jgi:hypothetical protein